MEQGAGRTRAAARGNGGEGPGAAAAPGGHHAAERQAAYLYAIVEGRGALIPDVLPCAGVTGSPVYVVASQGLAAVMSPVAPEEFSGDAPASGVHEVEWITANAIAHQEVLAWLLARRCTVAPVKFGTLCAGPDHIRTVLARDHRHFMDTLERLRGAAEWGVKVFCDRRAVTEWVARRNPHDARMREHAAKMSEGAAYFALMQLERRARREAEHLVRAQARDLHARLSGLARAVVAHPLPPRAMRRDGSMMLLRAAYLVADATVEAFCDAARMSGGIPDRPEVTCKTTGPWPPYNFVDAAPEDLG